jgi:three-Cys-motif partner protein
MVDKSWFEKPTEQSIVKARIVVSYFTAWSNVMKGVLSGSNTPRKMAYVDLFAGPGAYEDGTETTPLLILRKAVDDSFLKGHLAAFFNDKDAESIESLECRIREIAGFNDLRFKPQFSSDEVGERFTRWLERTDLSPSLSFIDPWGYKGLSLRLINACIKGWGCDCLFFFNYSRINRSLAVDLFKSHFEEIFGHTRLKEVISRIDTLVPHDREMLIIETLCEALKERCADYVLPFRFKEYNGKRTSHHLFLVTKHFKGYNIMKGILTKESTKKYQGVGEFEFAPVLGYQQSFLELFHRPVDELAEKMYLKYKEKQIKFDELYEHESVDTYFIEKHFRSAFHKLEELGKLRINLPNRKRIGSSIPDDALLSFV